MGLTAGIIGVAASAGGGLLNSHTQARALRSQAGAEARLAEQNASQAELLATDAISRGEREANILSGRAERLTGEQLSAYAASGVDITSASARAVIAQSRREAMDDVMTTKANALREAFGLKSQASNIRLSARLNTIGKRQAARSTAFGGTLGAFTSVLGGAAQFGAFNAAVPGGVPSGGGGSGITVPTYQPLPDDLGLA